MAAYFTLTKKGEKEPSRFMRTTATTTTTGGVGPYSLFPGTTFF